MSDSFYEFFCPVKLVVGAKALEHIPFELSALGASRPMIVTDKGVVGAGLLDTLMGVFPGSGIEVGAVFEGRVMHDGQSVVFGRTFLYHPGEARDVIVEGIASALGASQSKEEIIFQMARHHVRWHRLNHANAVRVYRGDHG